MRGRHAVQPTAPCSLHHAANPTAHPPNDAPSQLTIPTQPHLQAQHVGLLSRHQRGQGGHVLLQPPLLRLLHLLQQRLQYAETAQHTADVTQKAGRTTFCPAQELAQLWLLMLAMRLILRPSICNAPPHQGGSPAAPPRSSSGCGTPWRHQPAAAAACWHPRQGRLVPWAWLAPAWLWAWLLCSPCLP